MLGNKAQGRRTRFQARISTEREILSIVNSSDLCGDIPLAGMTTYAIADWERHAREKLKQGSAAKIVDILLEIGRRTELLSDDSRDVFDTNEIVQQDDIDQAKITLQVLVSQ